MPKFIIILTIMLNWLVELDKKAFLYLNGKHLPVFDDIMWLISDTRTWIPFFVILLAVIIYQERPYQFIITIVFAAITIVICDQLSTFIKDWVARPRPTHEPGIAHLVHTVNNYRGGAYGFVSSHAANSFGLAAFLACCFRSNKIGAFLFACAIIVSYSRIYLGVHYPFDIIFGAILGLLAGPQCYVFKARTASFIERKVKDRKYKK